MKKLVLFFAVAFAMSFASCGNKAAESTDAANDSTTVVTTPAAEEDSITTATPDSLEKDSANAEAAAPAAEVK